MSNNYSVYTLRVLSAQASDTSQRRPKRAPNLYVKIRHSESDVARHTPVVAKSYMPVWDKDFEFDFQVQDMSSLITLELKHKSRIPFISPSVFGKFEAEITHYLELCKTDGNAVIDMLITKNPSSQARLGWTLKIQLICKTQQEVTTGLQQRLEALESLAVTAEADSSNSALQKALHSLSSKLKVIEGVVGTITELSQAHPYINIAWKVISAAYAAYKAQQARDHQILQLVQSMNGCVTFITGVAELKSKQESFQKHLCGTMQQVLECAYFVQEYFQDAFTKRLLHQTWSSLAESISEMIEKLNLSSSLLNVDTVVHTALISSHVLEEVHALALKQYLRPADMSIYHRRECLPNTRQTVIDTILQSLMDTDEKNRIVWLYGPAGSGKSTIATSIAEHCRVLHRQGAFVFFDRAKTAESSPDKLIRTIAYQLGQQDPFIQSALAKTVKEQPNIADEKPYVQFSKLWVETLQQASKDQFREGPTIIIIDALDECGTAQERHSLLKLLAEDIPRLPSRFRFFITSREEHDIVQQFSDKSHIEEMLLDITLQSNEQDVELFLNHEIANIRRQKKFLSQDWPGGATMSLLLKKAGGLFIWASTAIAFIADGHNPKDQLEILCSSQSKDKAESSLHELYEIAFYTTNIWKDPASKTAMKWHKALGLVLVARRPLTDVEIDQLLGLENGYCSSYLFQHLKCLLHWSPGQPVHFLHTSIADYLIDSKHDGKPWFINIELHNHHMVTACFNIMQQQLHFNMGNIKSSHVFNKDINNLDNEISSSISSLLLYSCLLWIDHLREIDFDTGLCKD
ncbi:P-loop containing nucleoside triphosphate hydrolase protein, partial [Amylocystis lapponica]